MQYVNQNRNIFVGSSDQIAVDDGGIVGAFAHFTAGGEGIGFAAVLIMVTGYLADGSFNPFLYFRF